MGKLRGFWNFTKTVVLLIFLEIFRKLWVFLRLLWWYDRAIDLSKFTSIALWAIWKCLHRTTGMGCILWQQSSRLYQFRLHRQVMLTVDCWLLAVDSWLLMVWTIPMQPETILYEIRVSKSRKFAKGFEIFLMTDLTSGEMWNHKCDAILNSPGPKVSVSSWE